MRALGQPIRIQVRTRIQTRRQLEIALAPISRPLAPRAGGAVAAPGREIRRDPRDRGQVAKPSSGLLSQ